MKALEEIKQDLREQTPMLAAKCKDNEIGSFVRHKQSPQSDLDILVHF